ncbi:MAG: hypothetical protein ACP5KO_02345 [Caldimicrobium sp.]
MPFALARFGTKAGINLLKIHYNYKEASLEINYEVFIEALFNSLYFN